jgi:ParB-like chromosome segregation protein Spo0J
MQGKIPSQTLTNKLPENDEQATVHSTDPDILPAMEHPPLPELELCLAERLRLPDNLPKFLVQQPLLEEVQLIRRFGQIQSILVSQHLAGKSELLVLSNVGQYLALRQAGVLQVVCRILPAQTAPVKAFALRIVHDRQAYSSSLVMQAYLLKEAEEQLDRQELLSLLPLMGVKPQQHVLKERKKLLQLDSSVQQALHNKVLSNKCVPLLFRLPPAEQQQIVHLVTHYRLGGSKQQNLVDMLVELYLREGSTSKTLLTQWQQDVEPPRDNLPQEAQSLLSYLLARCNPHLVHAEKHFCEQVQRLQAPEHISITHTPAFEDEGVAVHINYANWSTLQAHWQQLLQLVAEDQGTAGNRESGSVK